MGTNKFIQVKDLVVYQLARKLSFLVWKIYEKINRHLQKILSDQFINSTYSIDANIVEGYGRFRFRDKIKFYYISRASMSESVSHWLELLLERNKINVDEYNEFRIVADKFQILLILRFSVMLRHSKHDLPYPLSVFEYLRLTENSITLLQQPIIK